MFGFFPDVLMGKDPKKALLENAAMVAAVTAGAPMMSGGGSSSGLLGPVMQGMQAAQTAQGLLASPQQAPIQAPARQGGQLDLSSIFQASQQQSQADAEAQKRREEEMQRYAMMMGGYRG